MRLLPFTLLFASSFALGFCMSIANELLGLHCRNNVFDIAVTNGSHVFELKGHTKANFQKACRCRLDRNEQFMLLPLFLKDSTQNVLLVCGSQLAPSLPQLAQIKFLTELPRSIFSINKGHDTSIAADENDVPVVKMPNFHTAFRLTLVEYDLRLPESAPGKVYTGLLVPNYLASLPINEDNRLAIASLVAPGNMLATTCYPQFYDSSLSTPTKCAIYTNMSSDYVTYANLCCCPTDSQFCRRKPQNAEIDCAAMNITHGLVENLEVMDELWTAENTQGNFCMIDMTANRDDAGVIWLSVRMRAQTEACINRCHSLETHYCSDRHQPRAEETLLCCCYGALCNLGKIMESLRYHFHRSNMTAKAHCRANTLLLPYMFKETMCVAFFDPLLNKVVYVDNYYQFITHIYVDRYFIPESGGIYSIDNCHAIVVMLQYADDEECQTRNYFEEDKGRQRLLLQCLCLSTDTEPFCDVSLFERLPTKWDRYRTKVLTNTQRFPPCDFLEKYRVFLHWPRDEIWQNLQAATDKAHRNVSENLNDWKNFICIYNYTIRQDVVEINAVPMSTSAPVDADMIANCINKPFYQRIEENLYACCHHRFYEMQDGTPQRCSFKDIMDRLNHFLISKNSAFDMNTSALVCGHQTCPYLPEAGCYFVRAFLDPKADGFRGGCLALLLRNKDPEDSLVAAVAPCAQEYFDGRCFATPASEAQHNKVVCCCRSTDRCDEIINHFEAAVYGMAVKEFQTLF